MTEGYHTARLQKTGAYKGEANYTFPSLKAAALFGSASVNTPTTSSVDVLDESGRVVLGLLPSAKDTHEWVPSTTSKGYTLVVS